MCDIRLQRSLQDNFVGRSCGSFLQYYLVGHSFEHTFVEG